jgi:hypothetical protein
MKQSVAGLLWLVFACIYIDAFVVMNEPSSLFGTVTADAAAVTNKTLRKCTREQANTVINVGCPPYSATPNDTGDDSKAFQAAVDALPPSGGTIIIPEGTYLFHNPLLIQKSLHLAGAGPMTVLSHNKDLATNGEANFIRIGGPARGTQDVTISDLTMQGPDKSQLRTPMIRIVSNTRGVKIRDLSFRNVSSTCILIYGDKIQSIEISGNKADEFYEQFVELGSGGISGVRIERNVARSTRGHAKLGSTKPFGVVFEPHASGEISDVSIVGNSISFDGMNNAELISTGGISLSRGDPHSFAYRRILIKDNRIKTAGVGIRVETLRSGRAAGPGSVVISGNHIEAAANFGIRVAVSSGSEYHDTVSINENIVRGYSGQAYYQYDGIRVEGNIIGPEIRGNQILPLTDGGTNSGRYGISIEPGVRNAAIKDNQVAGYHLGAISAGK